LICEFNLFLFYDLTLHITCDKCDQVEFKINRFTEKETVMKVFPNDTRIDTTLCARRALFQWSNNQLPSANDSSIVSHHPSSSMIRSG